MICLTGRSPLCHNASGSEPAPMSQSLFQPVQEAHSIVEQMVFFQFAPPLDHVMPALVSLKDELVEELPHHEMMQSIQVDFSGTAIINSDKKDTAGILIFSLGKHGNRDWLINITPESISIHCTVYTKWEDIWPVQEKYISAIFSKLTSSKSFLAALGMRWIDQFIHEGSAEEYRAEELLRHNSQLLTELAFQSGTRWHCHTGWFHSVSGPGVDAEVLNQLNVDSGQINQGGHLRTAVTINHTQQLRADAPIDKLAKFLPTSGAGRATLSALMETLHDGNKQVLGDLLNDSSCKRIGLRVGQAE